MKITIVGAGYVGLSNAVLLAQNHRVYVLDIDYEKIALINNKKSPIIDKELEDYLSSRELKLTATTDEIAAYECADFIVIATPTNYDPHMNFFDTSTIESVIESIQRINKEAIIVIKSTVPVGYTEQMQDRYPDVGILFTPEFLREGHALYDNLYPSRIIVGAPLDNVRLRKAAVVFAGLLAEGAIKEDIPVLYMNPTEAEAVKLFSNTFLALRVAYFNELDSYAELRGLNTKHIIEGVGYMNRVSAIITTTCPLVTAATAFQRTQSNSWRTTVTSPTILYQLLSTQTGQEKILLPNVCLRKNRASLVSTA